MNRTRQNLFVARNSDVNFALDEKRAKGTRGRGIGRGVGGQRRGVITGERHSYRIWAEISLLITACTATYVLHRPSRTDAILLTVPAPWRYVALPRNLCHCWRWWTTATVISAVTPHWLAITRAKWSGQSMCACAVPRWAIGIEGTVESEAPSYGTFRPNE